MYIMCIDDAGSAGEEEGGDMSEAAPPPKRSLSMKLKRKVKGRGGKKGGARRGKKGATAAARRVTPIPTLEENEGKLHDFYSCFEENLFVTLHIHCTVRCMNTDRPSRTHALHIPALTRTHLHIHLHTLTLRHTPSHIHPHVSVFYFLVDEDAVEPMEESNSRSAIATCSSASALHSQLPLSASSSSESVYESCVSQQSPVHVASPLSPLTPTGDATSQKSPFVTCEDCDVGSLDTQSRESGSLEAHKGGETATVVTKPASRIPVLRSVKSPQPSQRFISPKSPTPASPLVSVATSPLVSSLETDAPSLATTHVKSHREKENMGATVTSIKKDSKHTKGLPPSLINRDSPAGPLNATYRVSPMGVPYLSKGHTPNTIRQLHEKLISQTKGKLISLEELRNARSEIHVILKLFVQSPRLSLTSVVITLFSTCMHPLPEILLM